jgi:hydrogenase 3 maturation protease
MDKHLKNQLTRFLRGRICVLGIGNRFRHDDGAGSQIAESLESCTGVDTVNAGWVPENHFGTVARLDPDTILMIDAADFSGEPGQVRLIDPDSVAVSGLSTHTASLQMLAVYLRTRTHARVALLAIQPADTGPGEGLTPSVARTVKELQDELPEICQRYVAHHNRSAPH